MKHFPSEVACKYTWRTYQQKVLHELHLHTQDQHLHIIAPPGSGKTILGLEVARQLNEPTLILTPTISIRNQWIQRFKECFLPAGCNADWISHSIKEPRFLTVITYQSLHAACVGVQESEKALPSGEEPESEDSPTISEAFSEHVARQLIPRLRTIGFKTLVVDEAHHLQNAWWKSLDWLRQQLANPFVVALTATPPYDGSGLEWKRYSELCGPVDVEITLPELVAAGDLCPHQDYVYCSLPHEKEAQRLQTYHHRLLEFFNEIQRNEAFIQALQQHPFFTDPTTCAEAIYENTAYYSGILIFLNAVGTEISIQHLELIGNESVEIPAFSFEWLEILLRNFMFRDAESRKLHEALILDLERRLKNDGALENRQINFQGHERIRTLLSASLSKLQSIVDIAHAEYHTLRQDLRMVILTDFIRKEMMPQDHFDTLVINKIGVFPIFETLRQKLDTSVKLGILTGSLVVIPKSSLPMFRQIVHKHLSPTEKSPSITCRDLPHESAYVTVNTEERYGHWLLHWITELFEQGGIQVLVGTKSLLGEGWDAPCINSLVLASFVGSYVSSNQMRGRAIRTQHNNPGKTGNIWHLVCLDPHDPHGGEDLRLLQRRFKAFAGVSFNDSAGIENGIHRLGIPPDLRSAAEIEAFNQQMVSHATDRNTLLQRWQQALSRGTQLTELIKIPYYREKGQDYAQVRQLYFRNTTKYLFYEATLGLGYFASDYVIGFVRRLAQMTFADNLQTMLRAFIIAFGIYYGPKLYKAFRLFWKHGAIEKEINNIGRALLATLVSQKIFSSAQLTICTTQDEQGAVFCHLQGGSGYEQALFNNALGEILGQVENPRYLIIRRNRFFRWIKQTDYHSVPQIIANKKAAAESFARYWLEYVGDCDLIYTRHPEGRSVLLRARIHSLSAAFTEKAERISRWK